MKARMITMIFGLMMISKINAQMAVTDPGSYLNQIMQISAAADQLMQLKNNYDVAKENVDFFKKVNSRLKNTDYVAYVLDKQMELVSECGTVLTKSKSSGYNSKSLERKVEEILDRNRNLTKLLSQSLSEDYQMTDAQRINALTEVDKQTQQLYRELRDVSVSSQVVGEMIDLMESVK